MKTRMTLLVMALGLLCFTSCSKDDSDSKPEVIRLKTATSTIQNETSSMIFTYDKDNRMAKCLYGDASYDTILYYADSVIVSSYIDPSTLYSKTVYQLNSKGLAVTGECTYFLKSSANVSVFSPFHFPNASAIYTYEYDANGYMVEMTEIIEGMTNTYNYVIENGNTVSRTMYIGSIPIQVDLTFDTGKSNTIGDQNMGIDFRGKQDNNLMINITVPSLSSYSFNLVYEYDAKNRVTKQSIPDDLSYRLYTYVE